jgi:hypothetical protein
VYVIVSPVTANSGADLCSSIAGFTNRVKMVWVNQGLSMPLPSLYFTAAVLGKRPNGAAKLTLKVTIIVPEVAPLTVPMNQPICVPVISEGILDDVE